MRRTKTLVTLNKALKVQQYLSASKRELFLVLFFGSFEKFGNQQTRSEAFLFTFVLVKEVQNLHVNYWY